MPAVPEIFKRRPRITVSAISEIAEAEVVIIARRAAGEAVVYAGLIVKFERKKEIVLYETSPVFPSAMDASRAMLRVMEEAKNFVESERRK